MDFNGYQVQLRQDPERKHWVAFLMEVPTVSGIGSAPDKSLRRLWEAYSLARNVPGVKWPEPFSKASYTGRFSVRVSTSLHRQLAEGAQKESVSLNAWVTTLLERAVAAEAEDDEDEDTDKGMLEIG